METNQPSFSLYNLVFVSSLTIERPNHYYCAFALPCDLYKRHFVLRRRLINSVAITSMFSCMFYVLYLYFRWRWRLSSSKRLNMYMYVCMYRYVCVYVCMYIIVISCLFHIYRAEQSSDVTWTSSLIIEYTVSKNQTAIRLIWHNFTDSQHLLMIFVGLDLIQYSQLIR